MSTMRRLNLTSPLRIVINGSSRMAISSPPQPPLHQPHNCDWSFDFYFPPLNIIASVLRLAWTAEVMRHVINLTVSEVLFVPAIEELIIITRGLILLEGEDEFMFACAHCCLGIMESTFRHGNDWAFVLIAAHGKGFGQASQDARQLFERQGMEPIVDSDITQLNLLPHRSMRWFYLRYCCGCLDCQRTSNLNCHSLAPVFFNWIPHGLSWHCPDNSFFSSVTVAIIDCLNKTIKDNQSRIKPSVPTTRVKS
ncbi:hypothetical protein BDE02_09G048000 [Populus trichocarpa]|nr:hypothetical protein BDE02_09G048000 [Populus trichocarpa]